MKPEFIELLNNALPPVEVDSLLNAISATAPSVSIRLNRKKIESLGLSVDTILTVEHEAIPHCRDGFFLNSRPLFTSDPSLHAGLYYVQEANSMWIGEIVRSLVQNLPNNAVLLDMCAAPGGKTTHVSSVLRNGDVLVANEVISQRNSILFENVSKWGDGNTLITKADAKLFAKSEARFDIIMCDAPCSGEGMFRKDDAAIDEWSLDHVDLCVQRQQRIVFDLFNNLKPGGYFIYSTCTYNRKENEDNVTLFCTELGLEVVDMEWGEKEGLFCIEKGMYRCMPHRSKGEGLFFTVLRKPGDINNSSFSEDFHVKKHPQKNKKNPMKVTEIPVQITELFPESEFHITAKDDEFYAIRCGNVVSGNSASGNFASGNASNENAVNSKSAPANSNIAGIKQLLKDLPGLVHPGFPLGNVMKKKWKAHVAAALLIDSPLKANRWLNDAELAMYLRREFIPHQPQEESCTKSPTEGMVCVSFKLHENTDVNLGMGNSVKNGLNNLWPMEWRVRSIFQDTHRICG